MCGCVCFLQVASLWYMSLSGYTYWCTLWWLDLDGQHSADLVVWKEDPNFIAYQFKICKWLQKKNLGRTPRSTKMEPQKGAPSKRRFLFGNPHFQVLCLVSRNRWYQRHSAGYSVRKVLRNTEIRFMGSKSCKLFFGRNFPSNNTSYTPEIEHSP